MSTDSTQPAFLDAQKLLDSSRAAPLRVPTWPLLVLVAIGIFILSADPANPYVKGLQFSLFPLLFLIVIGMTVFRVRTNSRLAAESDAVTTLDELIQLRRWPEAADLAQRILGQPMVAADRRVFALLGLASLLTRYHRFADARLVHEALLDPQADEPGVDPTLGHSIKVARAMSLLREDHLVDADRAMTDLRREVNQARDDVRREQGAEQARKIQSAGVVLLDLYRDVKTGHPEEALAVFERAMPALREQLGVRVADAWVLAAAAHHVLGHAEQAAEAYTNATLLVPAVELHRRYPETAPLAQAYKSSTWPIA